MTDWTPTLSDEVVAQIAENRRFHRFLEERSEHRAAVRKGHKMRRAAQLRAWEEECARVVREAEYARVVREAREANP